MRLEPGKWSDALEFDGKVLKTVHGPRWRLLIIGAGQTSRYLAQMAKALDYHVTVCDPREEYADEWDLPGADAAARLSRRRRARDESRRRTSRSSR